MSKKQDITSILASNTSHPLSSYPELPDVLERFITGLKVNLTTNLVGAYLVGSLATGDFDMDSDVDFIVVTKNALNTQEVHSIETIHANIFALDCYPAKHLEGSYMSVVLLNNYNEVGRNKTWFLDNGSQHLEQSDHDDRWHVRWILRERGIALLGQDPQHILPPVPMDAMCAELRAKLHRLREQFSIELSQPLGYYNSRFGQSFAVLTVCRVLHSLQSSTIQSKLAGAQWARQSLAYRWHNLIDQAQAERIGVRFCEKIRQRAVQNVLEATLKFIEYGIVVSETGLGAG